MELTSFNFIFVCLIICLSVVKPERIISNSHYSQSRIVYWGDIYRIPFLHLTD